MQNNKVKMMARVGLLSAMSVVLAFLQTPALFGTGFLKLDFADVPAVMVAMAFWPMGPVYGVTVVLIKNLVALTWTTSGGIGELANFIYGSIMVLSLSTLYRFVPMKRERIGIAVWGLLGTSAMTVAAYFINKFVIFRLYSAFMPYDELLLTLPAVIGFNILKGTAITLISAILYKRVGMILNK